MERKRKIEGPLRFKSTGKVQPIVEEWSQQVLPHFQLATPGILAEQEPWRPIGGPARWSKARSSNLDQGLATLQLQFSQLVQALQTDSTATGTGALGLKDRAQQRGSILFQ